MFGDQCVERIGEMLTGLVRMHKSEIIKAYLKTDSSLTLSFSAKMKNNPDGDGVKIDTGITFTAEKINDSITSTVLEGQGELFYGEKEENL